MAVRLRAVCEALQSAFSEDEFERLLLDFGANLDDIAAPGAWPSRVYEVVLWAQRGGRLAALVLAAQAANPGNAALRELAGESVTGRGGVGTANRRMDEFQPVGNGSERRLGEQLGRLASDLAHLQRSQEATQAEVRQLAGNVQKLIEQRERWTPGLWLATSIAFAALVTAGALWVILLP